MQAAKNPLKGFLPNCTTKIVYRKIDKYVGVTKAKAFEKWRGVTALSCDEQNEFPTKNC